MILSAVVLGELFYGAFNSGQREANLRRVELLTARFRVLDVDAEISRAHGRIKEALKRRGRPIPENDIWVAATAIRHGLTLVTRDAHFPEVDGLQIESW